MRDRSIRTVPQLIVHTLDDVNRQMKEGRYFFTDIIRDGAMLYKLEETRPNGVPKHRLAEPVLPDPQAVYEVAKGYCDHWLESAVISLKGARFYHGESHLNEAAFNLHQATERAYMAFLLTRTYVPKDHNIKHLRSHAEDLEPAVARGLAARPQTLQPVF